MLLITSFLHQGPQGSGPGDLLNKYNAMVKVPDLIVGGPVPHKFNSGYVHL